MNLSAIAKKTMKKTGISIARPVINYTFENADESTDQELLKKVKRYVEKFESMRERNIGLFIYGSIGTGKTYISCCIANAVIEKDQYEVVFL